MCLLELDRMNIRPAQKMDLAQLIDLCREHAEFERVDYVSKNKHDRLAELLFGPNPILKCMVVEENDMLVGYATFMKQFSTWDADCYIYMDCLFLKKHIRGKGIGSLMLEKVRQYAKDEQCLMVQWQTPSFNIKAIDFYKKMGALSKNKERFYSYI